jgi:four helix bundle protein
MTWKRFEDIDAWQMARALNLQIHELIINTPISQHFALKDQLYRAAGSIMDNIAEGFERGSNRDFRTFLGYAKGSCGEVRSQLYRSVNFNYISESTFERLKQEVMFTAGKIYKIIEHLNNSHFKGHRLK